MEKKKRFTINKKFTINSILVSLVTLVLAFFVLNIYKSNLKEDIYNSTQSKLITKLDSQIESKKSIGITNAYSIANDARVKESLLTNNRELAITSLHNINKIFKEHTKFKNIKIHIHTKDNRSFIRNWKLNKYGDDLSSFRKSVVTVNRTQSPVNGFEIGKAGLSLRSVVPIIDNGVHLGSLEFIQGLNSVAKDFNKHEEGFLLLMDIDKKVVEPNPDKILDGKYIISQKFINSDFFEDIKTINIEELQKNKYLISNNYLYTSKVVEDFEGNRLGLYIVAEHLNIVHMAVNQATNIIYIALMMIVVVALVNLITTLINMKKSVLTPIKNLEKSIISISHNENSSKIEVQNNDEIGDVVIEFNNYLNFIEEGIKKDQEVIDESQEVIKRANRGLLNTSIKKRGNSQGVNDLAVAINELVAGTHRNLTLLADILAEYSNARYDVKIEKIDNTTGEVASIMDGIKTTGGTISGILAMIDNTTTQLLTSATQLNKASSDLSNSSNMQASGLEQTAAAIEQILSTIKQSHANTEKMATLAKKVTDSTKHGEEMAHKTSESMSHITNEVNEINEAITIIDQIAFQTNILSLNAAVEAATAGEAGKGFAVVAQEVRNLASRSADAANDIKSLVEKAILKAKEGQNVSTQMIEGYTSLNNDIMSTIELIEEVAVASKEQKNAISQISGTVNDLDKVTQENASVASSINNMASVNEELALGLETTIKRTKFHEKSKDQVCDIDLMFDLDSLKADHVKFKNEAFAKCEDGQRFKVTTHHECRMGKWIENMKDEDFLNAPVWEELKEAHRKVHMMTQDTVDLYAGGYSSGQVFSVTNNVEDNINKVFEKLDELREYKCMKMKERGN
jgi:methyl-accepting chemotaxis protein